MDKFPETLEDQLTYYIHEEVILKKILHAVKTEINKLQVEQLHLQSQVQKEPRAPESESDEDMPEQSVQDLIKEMDNAGVVNQKSIELDAKTPARGEVEEEEEEEDEDDEM